MAMVMWGTVSWHPGPELETLNKTNTNTYKKPTQQTNEQPWPIWGRSGVLPGHPGQSRTRSWIGPGSIRGAPESTQINTHRENVSTSTKKKGFGIDLELTWTDLEFI